MSKSSLNFLHCNFFPRCEAHVDKYFEGYHTLQLMTGGGVDLHYDKKIYRLEGNWFWPAFPGPRIKFFLAPKHPYWVHRYAAFQGDAVQRWKKEGLWLTEPQPMPKNIDCISLFDELLDQAFKNNVWSQRRAANLLEGLLIELARARNEPETGGPWLERVILELERPLAPNATASEPDYAAIAVKLDMGLSTLRRRFVQATGMPLHDYYMKKRCESARTLLGETDWPVKQIAESLGFRDVYFFSRQFKQLTGCRRGSIARVGNKLRPGGPDSLYIGVAKQQLT